MWVHTVTLLSSCHNSVCFCTVHRHIQELSPQVPEGTRGGLADSLLEGKCFLGKSDSILIWKTGKASTASLICFTKPRPVSSQAISPSHFLTVVVLLTQPLFYI